MKPGNPYNQNIELEKWTQYNSGYDAHMQSPYFFKLGGKPISPFAHGVHTAANELKMIKLLEGKT